MAIATLDRLSYAYPGATAPALREASLEVEPGITLLAGASGSGKSTLLRVLDGLVPHFHGGRISGAACVVGEDVVATPTRRLARHVGFVFQDPELSFVYGTVEREVAFALENVGTTRDEMRRRVGEALERLGVAELRTRQVGTLSGGERQRVAIAAALVLRPIVVALDEPTSQLDPVGAASVVDACLELGRAGLAVVVSEHRLERLLPAADHVVLVEAGRPSVPMTPVAAAAFVPSPPQVVELGVACGWRPIPLTVVDARLRAPTLASRNGTHPRTLGDVAWALVGASVGPGEEAVVEGADVSGRSGEVVVLMGPNGHGKTTVLRAIAGIRDPLAGRVERAPGRVAYVPQNPTAALHRPTVREEVLLTLRRTASPANQGSRSSAGGPPAKDARAAIEVEASGVLERLGLTGLADRYPRDLSSGERQRVAIAASVAGSPGIAILDEPTRGMDRLAREEIASVILGLRDAGAAVVVATHDSTLAAAIADRIVEVRDGRLVELGPPARALSDGSTYATQMGQLYPGGPVTVTDVLAHVARLGVEASSNDARGRAR